MAIAQRFPTEHLLRPSGRTYFLFLDFLGAQSALDSSISGEPVCVRCPGRVCCRLLDDFGLPTASAGTDVVCCRGARVM